MTPSTPAPALSAVVVHWRNEGALAELLAAWPDDPRFELLVVDNGGALDGLAPPARLLAPGRNLGFAGGVNAGVEATRGELVLLLNPDARPLPGALDALVDGFARLPEVDGLAPALEDPEGRSQHRWQLRRLPRPTTLLLHTLFVDAGRGPDRPPAPGEPVEQPAAAALALRREALDAVGGLDAGFFPAWFEDVDLARRLARAGRRLAAWPAARFVHAGGGSLPALGYGPFLWIYSRNLVRYLGLHHGRGWAGAARLTLVLGLLLRLAALPLRRPRRAAGRGDAARGLGQALAGALSGWRRPVELAGRFAVPTREAS